MNAANLRMITLLCVCGIGAGTAQAGAVDLRKFALLRDGMTEAEVLYRLGPYDHEAIYYGHYDAPVKKVWYYIPNGHYSGDWITEITFDSNGLVQKLDRFKPTP